jgi:pimeloyl-ACP methyl ester carboxylesterase
VQGTRDRLCPLDLLESARREMKALNELYVVDGGDHSLLVEKARLKTSGETQDQIEQRIMATIESFASANCAQYLSRPPV